MAGRFVRSSKYRHVFGRPTRKEQCYDNLRISKNAWDSNLVKANPEYISVNWEASGGGAFAVIPVEERGRVPDRIPLFRGHTAVVLDTDWNPFNDSLLASGSDDGKVFLWRVPENFTLHPDVKPDEIEDVAPVGKLSGHPRKVGHVLFNPAAENVLASSSGDFTIKLWDIEAGTAKLSLKVGEVIQSMSWSANGSLLVTTSRDKKLRIWDARQEKPVVETAGHAGAKNSRAVWMGEHDRIATTGFSRMSDRQLALWDIKAYREPVGGFQMLDSISGVCVPFWDDGTQCLYLAGKGDGNIRYYEFENDNFEYLSEYKSADPQRGIAFVPKRGVNTHENEVMRAYKTVNDSHIEPVSFIVPRRAEAFQEDIYPPTVGLKPAVSGKEWFEGSEGLPPKISMESLFDGQGIKEVPQDEIKPAARPAPKAEPAPTATKKQEEPVVVEPPSVASKAPPASMKEQGASMSSMVDRFADTEPTEEEDEESEFEEISKPAQRPATKSVPEDVVKESVSAETPSTVKVEGALPPKKDTTPTSTTQKQEEQIDLQPQTTSTASELDEDVQTSSAGTNEATSIASLEREMRNMKTVIAQQTRQITILQKTVEALVSALKK
ncbi:Coronin-like protein crn1 [Lithohypha guttulata]|uniref:Coronin-like protein crn1 n=1 Tax=Lithohypha guttulata TaxID=1690604 RepID=UPI002DDF1F78|nr:Coronin-like protein crn1 [Lithohypha guttulata]